MYMQTYDQIVKMLSDERVPYMSMPDNIDLFDEKDHYGLYFSSGCRHELRYLEVGKSVKVYIDSVEIVALNDEECDWHRLMKFYNEGVEVASCMVDYIGRNCEECAHYDNCDYEDYVEDEE